MADFLEFDLGSAIIEIPAEATDDQRRAIIAKFRQTPEFDQLVDKTRGAPAEVRSIVGGAPQQDRLANIQRYYPDALPFGDDNFVFTDPETKRPTLYNPEGLDVGDVASVSRELVQTVGAGLGAAAGGIAGTAMGLPTGPGAVLTGSTGVALGAGAGNAAAGALYDTAMNWIAGRTDTRSSLQVVLDSTAEFGLGAAGQRGGELIGAGVKRAVAGATPEVQRLVAAYTRLGIDPPAAAVSGSRSTQTIAKSLESSPFSADIMQRQAEEVLAQTKAAVDDVVSRFGQAQTSQGVGGVIKQAAVNAAERFGFRQEQLYEDAFNMIGPDTPVAMASVQALRRELATELGRAPAALERVLGPAVNQLDALIDDAQRNGGGIAFDALRQVRTAIGKDLAAPMLSGSTGAQNEAMKRIYGALTEDLSAAARQAGPDAAKALAVADRYTRMFMTASAKTMDKIARFEADENAFKFAMSASKDGGTGLTRMRRHFLPEEWDTVAASVLARMGRARPYAQDATGELFSVNTFLTNWSGLAPEAKQALFGGKRYEDLAPALDDLVTVIGSLKEVEALTNTSNTARAMFTLSVLGTIGAGLGGAVTGDVGGAGLGVIGQAMATRGIAKLMTSPAFVRWLAATPEATTSISGHMAQLYVIAEGSPEIREEIYQYLQAMRGAPAQAPAEAAAGAEAPPSP